MSGKPRLDAEVRKNRTRVGVNCSKQQKTLMEAAAVERGTDVGTLMLTYTLNGIGVLAAADTGKADGKVDVPVIINGTVGATLRARAAAMGVPPERILELLLGAGGG